MPSTQVIYNIVARDNASRTFTRVADSSTQLERGMGRLGGAMKSALVGLGAADLIGVAAVKMAADFQSQMTRVETGAGELKKNMGLVSDGVLKMAGQVGQSTSSLTAGLYTVESAGYHGADALNVLRNAAMGAKVGAADLGTVTDAVTTALNAYKLGAGQAAEVTNALIATESEGKTNMEALAGSLSTVLPTAAAAKVGLNEVLGAMATMTAQGTPAADAATYLRQTIGQLSNPSGKAAQEMKSLGLSAVQVGQELGTKGLAATLQTLTDAITKHMGPAGTVLIQHLQKAAKNTTDFQKVLANLAPAQQTYVGALATMVGGTKSMQAALELTGPHMKDFIKNTDGIAEHVKKGGKQIEGWDAVQATFNQKLAEAKYGLQALAIQMGTKLLPVASSVVSVIGTKLVPAVSHFAGFLTDTAIPDVIKFGESLVNKLVPVSTVKSEFGKVEKTVSDFFDALLGKNAAKAKKGISVAPPLLKPLTLTPPKLLAKPPEPIPFPEMEGFIGAMPKKSKATDSMAKTLGDQIRNAVQGGIQNIKWGPLGASLGKGLLSAFDWLAKNTGQIMDKLLKAFSSIDWLKVGKQVGGTALPFIIGFVNNLFEPLFSGSFWSKHWSDILLFAVTLIPIGKFAGAVGKVLEKIPFLKMFAPVFKSIEGLGGAMEKPFGKLIKGLGKFGKSVWDGIVKGFTKVFPESAGKVGKFIEDFALGIFGYWARFGAAGVRLIKGLGDGILSMGEKVGEWIGKAIGWLIKPFAKAGSWLLSKGRDFVGGLLNGIADIGKTVGGWLLDKVINPGLHMFIDANVWLISKGMDLISGLKNGVVRIASTIGQWLYANVISPVVGAFSKAGSWLWDAGGHLLTGLKNGIVNAVSGISSWIKSNIVDPVVNAVKHWFGIHSPSTVFAELGGHLTAGLLKGMASTGGTEIARMVFGDLPSALGHFIEKGLVSISNLPSKAMKALGSLGGDLLGFLGLGGGGGGSSKNQQIGETLAAAYGWSGPQWAALKSLWNGESGWNERALNASSGAYGIPQSLPASKMASAGSDWRTNAATQIKWGLDYIRSVYGNPLNAYSQWLARSPHWYDQGGFLPPGLSLVANGLGRREPMAVFTPDQWATLRELAAGRGGSTGQPIEVRVFIGEQELTDIVRVEVAHGHHELAAALNAGPGW
ncbi:phage tail tape measure protein [Streptomyces hygroscopicus]|uniref:phage tail tape measure protein n=1 Tax=Streptomyces hygroscopicus TaxID=1912 RepID=UPI0022408994|nr:phage tail tape measure protein [Streptomyces hygroscopicus]